MTRHPTRVLESPRVNPVGLPEVPPSFARCPREYSRAVRLVAAGVLFVFGSVGVAATVLSLGSYCLTSQAGVPAPL